MYRTDTLDVWNLTPGGPAHVYAQHVFNVVGALHQPETVASLHYTINGAPERPVFFRPAGARGTRLIRPGHFNIDTLTRDDLDAENALTLRVCTHDGREQTHAIPFTAAPPPAAEPAFHLDLGTADAAEAHGQVVDGHWQVRTDEAGRRCLEVLPEDAGYDRLLMFGRDAWTTGYEVRATLEVTAWTRLRYQNVGLVFKWNPHLQGDGTSLPDQWSTGLAYYAAQCLGLRLRFGVDVHYDEAGRKVGCTVLREKPLSYWLRFVGFVKNEALRIGKKPITQLRAGTRYHYRLVVHPDRYTLTVWPNGEAEPAPQLVAERPPELLAGGCVGIIAANCGVRVYALDVRPLPMEQQKKEVHAQPRELVRLGV